MDRRADDQRRTYIGAFGVVAVGLEAMELFLANGTPLLARKFCHAGGSKVVPPKSRLAYVGDESAALKERGSVKSLSPESPLSLQLDERSASLVSFPGGRRRSPTVNIGKSVLCRIAH
ncbi:hypothetical protein MHYP_G00128350 [Metynnis hypsauchen]